MNISRTNSVSGSSPSVDSFQSPTKKQDPAKAPAAGVANSGATPESPVTDNAHYGKRLRAYAEKIETRLKHALASPDLTRDQHTAIMKQSDKFQALMKRLENAYASNNDTAMKNMHHAIGALATSVNQALAGTKSAGPAIPPISSDVSSPQQGGGLDTLA